MVDYIKQPTPGPVMSQQAREDHATLPEHIRFENALAIWIRDMRDEQLELVKRGGRLSVAALAYEEVLKLRGILGRFMTDRKRRIQGRWDRRRERRALNKNSVLVPEHPYIRCWCGSLDCQLISHQ